MAAEMGVDRLCWEITDHPEDSYSRRFAQGTPDYEAIRHEIWDMSGLGNAIAGATPRARIELRDVPRDVPLVARAGEPLTVRTRVRNLCQRPFASTTPHGRRLVRLGAQLADGGGAVIDRDYARAWLPGPLDAGQRVDVAIEVPTPAAPGRYQLRFDLVSEGIDWFETCGSEVTVRELVVR